MLDKNDNSRYAEFEIKIDNKVYKGSSQQILAKINKDVVRHIDRPYSSQSHRE